MKRFVAYWILASLMVLTAPEVLIPGHDHEHEHEHEADHQDFSDEEADEDCFVCDFDLAAANVPTLNIEAVVFESEFAMNEFIQRDLRSEQFALFQHRGPPQA